MINKLLIQFDSVHHDSDSVGDISVIMSILLYSIYIMFLVFETVLKCPYYASSLFYFWGLLEHIYIRGGRYDQNRISRYDKFYITITIYITI